jgi:hypothetical protein
VYVIVGGSKGVRVRVWKCVSRRVEYWKMAVCDEVMWDYERNRARPA